MQTAWFVTIALMLTAYVVLDGFDFGAGIMHLFVAKTDEERRTVLAAIGPFWDGNEVWLVASGGVLVFAFPRVYAVICSGFYLPLTMVLWLLIARGVAIEFRSQEQDLLWRAFWDGTFALSPAAMALVLGVTFGNLVRGFPIEPGRFFAMPLFTDFHTAPVAGAFDWYTVTAGAIALSALGAHGAAYLAWKTEAEVQRRSERLARRMWLTTLLGLVLGTAATWQVTPELLVHVFARALSYPVLLLVLSAAIVLGRALHLRLHLQAFLGSCAIIAGMLMLTAIGMYPTLLRSTYDAEANLTAMNASSARAGLIAGFWWWAPAMTLAVGYFVFLFRMFRGKANAGDYGH